MLGREAHQPRGRSLAVTVGFGRCKACCGRTELALEGRDTAQCPRHLAVKNDDEFSHTPPRPSGRSTRVPHQDAVLGLWWSVLDDVKLVAGELSVPVKVVILRSVRTAAQAHLMTHTHTLLFRHFRSALHVVVVSMTAPDVHHGDVSHD